MPGTVLGALLPLTPLIFIKNLVLIPFIDEQTKAQSGQAICLRS